MGNPPGPKAGQTVKRYRRRLGHTQRSLASAAGMSMWTVREIEQGRRGIGKESMRRLSPVLGRAFVREIQEGMTHATTGAS